MEKCPSFPYGGSAERTGWSLVAPVEKKIWRSPPLQRKMTRVILCSSTTEVHRCGLCVCACVCIYRWVTGLLRSPAVITQTFLALWVWLLPSIPCPSSSSSLSAALLTHNYPLPPYPSSLLSSHSFLLFTKFSPFSHSSLTRHPLPFSCFSYLPTLPQTQPLFTLLCNTTFPYPLTQSTSLLPLPNHFLPSYPTQPS